MSFVTVCIADTEILFSEALARSLLRCADIGIVDSFPTSALDALSDISLLKPDVAVLDYWLRGMEAAALVESIRARSPDTSVMHLGWFHGDQEIKNSITAGAAAFISKESSADDLHQAVHRVHSGDVPVVPQGLEDGFLQRESPPEQQRRLATMLTPREIEILGCLGLGMTVDQLARRLGLRASTVRVHVHRILGKTAARSQVEAVAMARNEGLIP